MKHLPKHLQPRWRYLAVAIEAWPDAGLTRRALADRLERAARGLLGDVGAAEVDLSILRFDVREGTGRAVVRTRRGETERVRAVLAAIDAVDGAPVALRVQGVSGTVRGCEEKYIGREPEAPSQSHVAFEGAEAVALRRGDRLDVRTDGGFAGATDLDI